jgi:hypothetical protein
MSALKMPGFTAEASLYHVSERYVANRTLAAQADGRKILPQQLQCYQSGSDICCCMWGFANVAADRTYCGNE